MIDTLLELIETEDRKKRERSIIPTFTTCLSVSQKLGISKDQVLVFAKVLQKKNKIRIGQTISDTYFEIVRT